MTGSLAFATQTVAFAPIFVREDDRPKDNQTWVLTHVLGRTNPRGLLMVLQNQVSGFFAASHGGVETARGCVFAR